MRKALHVKQPTLQLFSIVNLNQAEKFDQLHMKKRWQNLNRLTVRKLKMMEEANQSNAIEESKEEM